MFGFGKKQAAVAEAGADSLPAGAAPDPDLTRTIEVDLDGARYEAHYVGRTRKGRHAVEINYGGCAGWTLEEVDLSEIRNA